MNGWDDPLVTAEALSDLHRNHRQPDPERVCKLKKSYVDKQGKERYIELDYLGHAETTDVLLAADPFWAWEPVSFTEKGNPTLIVDGGGSPVGLWIRLTVCGHTRLGYGSCQPGKQEAIKELIGDAIRNAAMRFGVALALWSRSEGWGSQS